MSVVLAKHQRLHSAHSSGYPSILPQITRTHQITEESQPNLTMSEREERPLTPAESEKGDVPPTPTSESSVPPQDKAPLQQDLVKPVETSEFTVRSVLVLISCSAALFCTAGFLNAYGVLAYYTLHYLPTYSNFQISWIGSFSIFMFFVNGVPAGILTDKCGPTIPIAIGAVCELVAVFMVSLCKEYYQFFLAQGVLLGIGMAYITIAVTSTLPRYFVRNRGLAQGVSIAGSSLGGVIWPIVLDELLDTDGISFGWTLRICGFMMLPLMVIVIIGVKRPIVPKKQPVDSEAGLTRITTKEQKASDAKARKADLARLRHPSFILLCSGLALFYFGFFSPFFYLTTYAIHIGETQSFAFYLIAILNAASLFGRVIPGYIADRVGPFNIITVSMLGSAIVCFCWTAVTNTAGIVVFALAYGFISGATLSLQFACVGAVASKETVGQAIGIVQTSIALTALFGTPIAGELVGAGGYIALSTFSGAIMLVGGAFVLAARFARSKKLMEKV
ncbi:major facilitator superfamily domain-containing protein [Neohortaea acidophila]|uniref:Major facilitator superfamily domain-containing protein n=1 Tax=Neohortaea acidophila TaxID=245834 RepID=A0A6A6PS03_9PEZI|nr:major facilitator superfamily domain-containing protein [Neohortaea acidophila]KAF2482908.1 major facilitator superfamily domain-containing protein [Neohortaea acidophila]